MKRERTKCEQVIGAQPLSAWDATTIPYIVTCPHEAERNARHCWRHQPPINTNERNTA